MKSKLKRPALLAAAPGLATTCQYRGCKKPAEVEVSGPALSQPGWWRMCATHRRIFAAQRPLAGANAGWIYTAIWVGGIEYERAIIASPAKVAMLAARAMASGCQQINIEKQKHFL